MGNSPHSSGLESVTGDASMAPEAFSFCFLEFLYLTCFEGSIENSREISFYKNTVPFVRAPLSLFILKSHLIVPSFSGIIISISKFWEDTSIQIIYPFRQ